jgi:hypothetical protein
MKFLEIASFTAINSVLARLETRECIVSGKIEAYACTRKFIACHLVSQTHKRTIILTMLAISSRNR